jgi:hypothetical protein
VQTTLMPFVDFARATFRVAADRAEPAPPSQSMLLGSLVYRPALFRRNEIRWISAYAWRSRTRARGLEALKRAKETLDQSVIANAGTSIATLIREMFGEKPVDSITCIPCGHSRRGDCFGKQLAQSVARMAELPFVQIFADRPCPGASHPKEFVNLPPLQQIADPPRSTIVIDDLATSGWHLEESMLSLRRLGVAASSVVWISGAASSGTRLSTHLGEPATKRRQRPTAGPSPTARQRLTGRDLGR